MPFRRNNRRSRRPRRRRRRPRRRRRRRMPVMDPERKFLDTIPQPFPTPINNVGSVFLMNGIAEGTSQRERIGLQFLSLSLLMKYRLTNVGVLPTITRVALILFKQPAGVALTLNQVWNQNGTDLAPNAPRSLPHAFKYRILWTRVHRMDPLTIPVVSRTFMKKFRIKTRFAAATGGVADIVTGSLWFIAISDQPAAAATQPELIFANRVRFVG